MTARSPSCSGSPPVNGGRGWGGPLVNFMQILFLADAIFEDIPGGSRVVARELAHGLAARGHQVTFLVGRHTPEGPDEVRHGSVRIVRYPGAGSPLAFMRQGRVACARLWAEQPFDIVHTHFAYAALGPLQAVPHAAPHVRSFYGPWDEEGWVEDTNRCPGPLGLAKARVKRSLRHRVEAANLQRSQAVVVLSEHSRGEVQAFGYPDRNINLIPGGTDTDRFRPAPDKRAVRQSLGLPQDRTLLLSIRRLAPRMGLDNLLRALPAVVAQRPDTLLLIGGKGPEREHLENLAAETGMTDHVRLLGFIPDDQLAAHYQAADLFVLPTLALEGFGLVTTEALSCGIPVLGTDVGATPEILSGLDPRLIVPGTSPEALATAISSFLEQDWARELTPDRLRRFVLDHYQWDQHVEAVESLYQELISTGPIVPSHDPTPSPKAR